MSEECPLCLQRFDSADLLQVHASSCGLESTAFGDAQCNDGASMEIPRTSFDEEVKEVVSKLRNSKWLLPVMRRNFITTADDQLMSASDEDWSQQLEIRFIGEEGVDIGGLRREFFSILFRKTPAFSGNTFSMITPLLNSKYYLKVGHAVAYSFLMGHPGPRRFHPSIGEFILSGLEPRKLDINTQDISDPRVVAILNKIETGSGDEDPTEILQAAGFNKTLQGNEQDAITAVKQFTLFYRCMAPLLQFMEGLKLHGVLSLLRRFPEKAKEFLCQGSGVTSVDIIDFFKPSYSLVPEEKEAEEVVMYNFHAFLKKVQRQEISVDWVDPAFLEMPEIPSSTPKIVNLEDVLQCFVGCPALPRDLTSGLLLFDHQSMDRTSVNTCAPSIKFSQLSVIANYEHFQEHMISVILDTDGFGMR